MFGGQFWYLSVILLLDEVEFDVSMDTRTGKPVAVQVVKLKKGTVVFEVYSEERILGEIATPVLQSGGGSSPPSSANINGMKVGEKGDPCALSRYGSLCYDRMGVSTGCSYGHSVIENTFMLS